MHLLIIEDEPIIARRIKRMVEAILQTQVQSLQLCHSLPSGLAYLEKHSIDLLFLDLNLHGEDGFQVLEAMVAAPFHTIIISAYKDKAIQAFEYGVLDFIPKPFNQERMTKALARLKQVNLPERNTTRFLSVQKKGRHELLEIEDLAYVKGAGVYAELHFKNGKREIHNKNLEKLAQLLPERFERIHKSYIVNRSLVKAFLSEPGSKYFVLLEGDVSLPVGRTRYKDLKQRWAI